MPVAILVVTFAAFAVISPSFGTIGNMLNVAGQVAPLVLVTLGQAVVLLTGGFDISVGSVAAFAGVAAALAAVSGLGGHGALGLVVAVMAALAAGAACGGLNGWAVSHFRVQPVVATLGMLMFARGAALLVSHGDPVVGLPDPFITLGYGTWGGVPVGAIVALVAVVLMEGFLVFTPLGRNILAVGGNESAARLNGVPVRRARLLAYLVCGLLVGLAAVLYTARANSAQPTLGNGLELRSIAAGVIGGVSLLGGRGRMWSAAVGAVVVGMLANGLNLAGLSPFLQDVAAGLTLLAAVLLQSGRWPWRRGARHGLGRRATVEEVRPRDVGTGASASPGRTGM